MSESIWSDMTKKEILEDYTEYDRMIREHIENFPKKTPSNCPIVGYTGHYIIREVDEWIQGLKNRIGGYDCSTPNKIEEEKQ